jgi:protein ImuA
MSLHAHPLLSRRPHRDRPALGLAPGLSLALARVHEGCGGARRSLAMWLAARSTGPVFWISPAWESGGLNPCGMAAIAEPARFTFLTPARAIDILWAAEEVLRAGIVPLVVADLPAPPALTPVRRLHLAAETGARDGSVAPLGLLLTPGPGGAPGVESRWQMDPAHGTAGPGWSLTRSRARTEPVQSWAIGWGKDGFTPRAATSPQPD